MALGRTGGALLLLAAGLIGVGRAEDALHPPFMGTARRLQQQMTDRCVEELDKLPGKSVEEVANCVATCLNEVPLLPRSKSARRPGPSRC